VGFGIGFGGKAAAVVELDAAVAAVEEFSATGEVLQKIEKATAMRVDFVGLFQLDDAKRSAAGAACVGSKMVPVPPRNKLFVLAFPAGENGHIAETFGQSAMHPPNLSTALAAFQHEGPPFYNAICLSEQGAGQ
jgi:hypothetical protein